MQQPLVLNELIRLQQREHGREMGRRDVNLRLRGIGTGCSTTPHCGHWREEVPVPRLGRGFPLAALIHHSEEVEERVGGM